LIASSAITARPAPASTSRCSADPARLDAIHGGEYLLGCLAKLEVGGIEQALLLLRIQHAFRRQQLEYLDAAIQLPAM
jgi:hypothetical protein